MTVKRARIVVKGKVQGVYFRASMKGVAERHGVRGWVRNLPNGNVEALIEGESSAVEAVIAWSQQGPPSAVIDNVAVEWEPASEEFTSFYIKR